MSLSKEEVNKVASLARMAVPAEHMEPYTTQLSAILALADQLQAVDTEQVEPMAHPLDMSQRLREDKVTETNQREHYQQVAPEVSQGLYLVPKVIE